MDIEKKRLRKPYGLYSSRHLKRILKNNVHVQLQEFGSKKGQPSNASVDNMSSESPSTNSFAYSSISVNDKCEPTITQTYRNVLKKKDLPQSLANDNDVHQDKFAESSESESNLKDFFKYLTSWCLENHISRYAFNRLLKIIKSYLGIKNCPRDCRTLLKVNSNKSKDIAALGTGSYYHFGIKNGIILTLEKYGCSPFIGNDIYLSVNIDGLPLTKSSSSQFWPILACADNIENSTPFPIGVFHGNTKPVDANEFLKSFVEEYNAIQQTGIEYNNVILTIKISKFLCDAPAKAFILNIKYHNAYNSCTKCWIDGDFIANKLSFLETTSPLRTDEEFKNLSDENYHKGRTILIQTNIGLVTGIPLDYMHLVCLGVCKKLLNLWIKGHQGVKLFKEDLEIINNKLEYCRKFTVREFSRLPRSLAEVDRWKATEFRQFLLYYGPYVLKTVLKEPFLSHFLSLHVAMRILVSPYLCKKYIDYAESLLIYFVKKFPNYYGSEYVSHNVHNLIHLCNDVRKYGCLDNFSCFKFENYMSFIKKTLKTSNFPLQQFVNRHEEFKVHHIFNYNTEYNVCKEMGQHDIDGELVTAYAEVKYNNLYLSVSEPNCYCYLETGDFIKISMFFFKGTDLICKGYKLLNITNYFESPCSSIEVYYGDVLDVSSCPETTIFPFKSILHKAMKIDTVVMALLHNIQ